MSCPLSLDDAFAYTKVQISIVCSDTKRQPWVVSVDKERIAIVHELPTGDKVDFLRYRDAQQESDFSKKNIKNRVEMLSRAIDDFYANKAVTSNDSASQ